MHGGSPAAASQRKTVKEADKEATLAPAGLIADDKPQCVERIAPAHPPSRGRETCLILGFMGFLLLLSGSLLTRFKEPAHAKKRIAIHHAFVYGRRSCTYSATTTTRRRTVTGATPRASSRRISAWTSADSLPVVYITH